MSKHLATNKIQTVQNTAFDKATAAQPACTLRLEAKGAK